MIEKLKKMQDLKFENLSFDILSLRGIENLVWRTPGRDGGRDLEGSLIRVDFAGETTVEKWYFECKRYTSSISWPTVFEKIAYAQSADADYLLILTSSNFSPQCRDEVTRWNSTHRRPQVREWPGYYISTILEAHPQILLKYSLGGKPKNLPRSTLELSLEIAKSTQAAYSASELGQSSASYIELAACLSDLLTGRLQDFGVEGRLVLEVFRGTTDAFPWLTIVGASPPPIDRLAIRALLSAIHLSNRTPLILEIASPNSVEIRSDSKPIQIPGTLHRLIKEICFWGDIEIQNKTNRIHVIQRAQNG